MNDIHGAHGASGIIEDPLLIQVDIPARQLLTQLANDELHDRTGIVPMSANGTQRQIMQLRGSEDVEPFQVQVQEVEQS